MTFMHRSSGILLHPTSLPGDYGIGDLGSQAYSWIDWLAECGCAWWQVLPLGPTGYGDSPYQCLSAFAGNTYLVSPMLLFKQGWLQTQDLVDSPAAHPDHVDFGSLIPWKIALLERSYQRFAGLQPNPARASFDAFCAVEAGWLDDFALFMTLKSEFQGKPWHEWPADLRSREPQAMQQAAERLHIEIEKRKFFQWLFFTQWDALKAHSVEKGIQIIGDIPIYMAYDSADVWSRPELFCLDAHGQPTVVAGVPPDYFSPTGQLWGNPLYKWEAHRQDGYQWWINRIRAALRLTDVLRLDHFRGFAGYWAVPAGNPTAEIGTWEKGPGAEFFELLQQTLGGIPIIAEDLGEITPDVFELRDRFELPGMKILQFAFDSTPANLFLPHKYPRQCIAYTGTHDNDTTVGWYASATEKARDFCRRYLSTSGDNIAWDLMRGIWQSVADVVIAPMQDCLSLGTDARMNYPGRQGGNWSWRMARGAASPELAARLHEMNFIYQRLPGQPEEKDLVNN
jgi:4-alpha-glucanotransferase